MSSRILYKTGTYDPETGLPVYILDSYFLPSSLLVSEQVKSDEELVNFLISKIDEKFVLVILSSSLSSIQNAKLPFKFYKLFKSIPASKVTFLRKIYIVHHNWLTKSMLEFFNVFNSKQNTMTIVHCDTLTILSHHLDLTKLNISLPTYVFDLNFNEKIIVPIHFQPIFQKPIIPDTPTFDVFERLYNKLIDYLVERKFDDLALLLEPKLPSQVSDRISILSESIKRHQLINLSDWSFVEIYKTLLQLVSSLNEIGQPLIPVSVVLQNEDPVSALLAHEYVYESKIYDNRYMILKVFKLGQIIHSKIHHDRGELLYILELSKDLYNLNYESNDHSKVFNEFFGFIKQICQDQFDLTFAPGYKVDEEEMLEMQRPVTPTAESRSADKPSETTKTIENFPPTPPMPRKLQTLTINDNHSLSSMSEEDDEHSLGLFSSNKENVKPKFERLVELHSPNLIPDQFETAEKPEKEVKLKPWVKGKKVGELALFYEKEMLP